MGNFTLDGSVWGQVSRTIFRTMGSRVAVANKSGFDGPRCFLMTLLLQDFDFVPHDTDARDFYGDGLSDLLQIK